jgi:hypothetical protein
MNDIEKAALDGTILLLLSTQASLPFKDWRGSPSLPEGVP